MSSHYSAPLAHRLMVLEEDNLLSEPAKAMIDGMLQILEKRPTRCPQYLRGTAVAGSAEYAWRATCALEYGHCGDHLFKMDQR